MFLVLRDFHSHFYITVNFDKVDYYLTDTEHKASPTKLVMYKRTILVKESRLQIDSFLGAQ
jgi:hypothetical protein